MGLEARESLLLWEDAYDELTECPTPRRERIGRRAQRLDNAVALSRLVLQTGVSDEEYRRFTAYRDAQRKKADRAAIKAMRG